MAAAPASKAPAPKRPTRRATEDEILATAHALGAALHRVGAVDAATMRDLAGLLACDASHVTSIVDRLEGRGLVARQTDANDRRVKLVALTDRGARVRVELLDALLEPPEEIVRLAQKEQRQLAALLRRALGYR